MLTRLNLIKNVGVFKNYRGGPIQFKKVNYIYAGNASGKSTLSDTLKDISDNNNLRINKRLTIPDGVSQQINLSIKVDTNEQYIKYNDNNGNWDNNSLKDKILVFDTEFIQNNVFSGLEFLEDRNVKENFSGFILGDSGVQKAEDLESLNRKLREERKKLKEKTPPSQVGNKDTQIKQYIEIKIDKTQEEIRKEKKRLEVKIQEEENLLTNTQEVLNYSGVPTLNINRISRFAETVNQLSDLSIKTFQITPDNIKEVTEHINKAFEGSDKQKAEAWIHQGVNYVNESDNCPFCGQDIKENELISNYQLVFNDKYSEFSKDIRKEVKEIFKSISQFNIFSDSEGTKIKFDKAVKLFGSTIELYREKLNSAFEELEEYIKINSDNFEKELEEANRVLELKKNLPTAEIQYNENGFITLLNSYKERIVKINSIIEKLNEDITKLKSKSQNNDKKELEELQKESNDVDKKLTRLLEEQICSDWINQKSLIERLVKCIKEKDEDLKTSQEKYLDSYFTDINYFFSKFGGHNFSIERGKDNNLGKKKVFGVNVLFRGKDITNITDSSKVFSESDRRALALSIFMAKLNNLKEEETSEMLIVFDDPVTSFDMDRMKSIANAMITCAKKVKQIFILSHQYSFSKTMYHDYGNKEYDGVGKIAYYQIIKTPNNSNIQEMNPDKYFDNEFMTQYNKILDFIDEKTSDFTGNDLRIFIEDYLETTFPHPYAREFNVGSGFTNLGTIINSLKEQGYISNTIANELTVYKDSLNTTSHNANTMTVVELRNYTKDVLTYLDSKFRII